MRRKTRPFEQKRIDRGAALRRVGTCLALAALAAACPPVAVAQQPKEPNTAEKKKEKDKRLGERLIRNTTTEAAEDVMDELIRLMERSARNLEISFDAGDETQSVQRRIMERLDDAIRAAAAQRRPTRSQSQSADGDKRRKPPQKRNDSKPGTPKPDQRGQSSVSLADGEKPAIAGVSAEASELAKRRRAWGHLPMREREEIIQGLSDRYLERYRLRIERYYRALQESND